MDFKQTLDDKISEYNLLDHPFYQAWSAGELSVECLKSYAGEYGAFITTIPKGWETIDDIETAKEETEHIEMWEDFADGLNTCISKAEIPQVKSLLDTAEKLFSQHETALGALYAFEVQQPETAKSKLDGLKEFDQLPPKVETYFVTHSHNEHEAEMILEKINKLPPASQEKVAVACEQMSSALWNALTGIHNAECV